MCARELNRQTGAGSGADAESECEYRCLRGTQHTKQAHQKSPATLLPLSTRHPPATMEASLVNATQLRL